MSIATALFSDSQARLFCWRFGQPECSYHLSELRRLSELGSVSLQRELNRLVDAGLVLSEHVGNLRRFQANPQSSAYAELVALTRKTLGAEPLLREALQPIAARLAGDSMAHPG
jgi:DNA-binding transcriptional ArsR family regulator